MLIWSSSSQFWDIVPKQTYCCNPYGQSLLQL